MATSTHSSRQIISEFEYSIHPKFSLGPNDVIIDAPREDETQPNEGGSVEAGAPLTKAKSKEKLSTL